MMVRDWRLTSTPGRAATPLILVGCLLLSVGCGGAPQAGGPTTRDTAAPKPDSEDPEPLAGITVTHTAEERWTVDYNLADEVLGIWLTPPTPAYHRSAWTLPEGFHITTHPASGLSSLERIDRAPFQQLSVDIETWHDMVTYAPQPFGVFESGTAINTMPLGFYQETARGQYTALRPAYTFRGLAGEDVVVAGALDDGLESLTLPPEGVFVFFGSTDGMQRTDRLSLLLDDDAPAGLDEVLFDSALAYEGLYTDLLGEPDTSPLVVFMTWTAASGASGGGNAQGSQIICQLYGPDAITGEDQRMFQSLLAHEMAHIWQAKVDAQWYSEGSAELLMMRALIDAEHDTEAGLVDMLNSAVAHTLAHLDQTPLDQAFRSDVPLLGYTAGVLVMAAAEAAAAADGVPEDIFDIDRAMAALPESTRSSSPVRGLSSVLQSLGATQDATDAIEVFITVRHADPQAALLDLFDATGMAYTLEDGQIVVM